MKHLRNEKTKYILLFVILFLIELFIAIFVRDKIIRPYFGDVVVIVLLYSLVRIFVKSANKNIVWKIFLFAIMIEVLQYFRIIEILRLQNNKFISILLGTTFDFTDIICYILGTLFVLLIEKIFEYKNINEYIK